MVQWLEITNAQLAEFQPVLARWITGFRDNVDAVAGRLVDIGGFRNCYTHNIVGGAAVWIAPTSGKTALRVYVPEYMVGTGGTKIIVPGRIDAPDSSIDYNVRLVHSSATGTAVTVTGTQTDADASPELTFTATGNAVARIDIETSRSNGVSTAGTFNFGSSTTDRVTLQRIDT